MSTTYITAATLGVNSIECDCCRNPASHLEMDYYHNHVVGMHRVLCLECAKRGDYEFCPCCPFSKPFDCENEDGVRVALYPVFSIGQLDGQGCCSEHP